MSDDNKTPEEELPSSDAVAPDTDAEIAQLEDALEATPAATPEPAADPEPDPQAPLAPTSSPEDPPVEAATKPAPARKPRNQAQKDKRKADDARRKTAIAEAQAEIVPPSEADEAEQDRKADIRSKMDAAQGELDDLVDACQEKKEELKALSAELYPHLVDSDHHVDAVRGYIESQKKLRANRAGSPARIKAILAAAGKSPIDAAFSAQRARGMTRPKRTPATPAATGGDAAPEASPDANAGQE